MPIINIYVDNEFYVKFLEKEAEERKRIRSEAQKVIMEEIDNQVNIDGRNYDNGFQEEDDSR